MVALKTILACVMLLACIASVSATNLEYKIPSSCTGQSICWMNETYGNGPGFYSVDGGHTWYSDANFKMIETNNVFITGITVRDFTVAEKAIYNQYEGVNTTIHGVVVQGDKMVEITYIPKYNRNTTLTLQLSYSEIVQGGKLRELEE